ncbi:gamma-tubulin complex component 3 homolog [Diadema antillarum]|uniref:gamma-tubulin complex component 3 homolog n=1 Tax=Diadema antillarum TaxID=105358 RepID=UPI003A8C697A
MASAEMAKVGQAGEDQSPAGLLHRLVQKILNKKEGEDVSTQFQYVVRVISSNLTPTIENDEFQVAERIKRKLAKDKREMDAAYFSELHRKLQSQGVLKNRWAALYLLLTLSEEKQGNKKLGSKSAAAIFGKGLPKLATSTPYLPRAEPLGGGRGSSMHPTQTPLPRDISAGTISSKSSHSSGIGSAISSISGPTPTPHSYAPGYLTDGVTPGTQSVGGRLARMLIGDSSVQPTGSSGNMVMAPSGVQTNTVEVEGISRGQDENTSFEVAEKTLVHDLIYVFQGIDGKMIKYSKTEDAFRIVHGLGVPRPCRDLVHKLSELGWLYLKVRRYIDARNNDKAFGLVGQSFCAALQQELTEYYRLLAVLEAQQLQEQDVGLEEGSPSNLSLFRLNVWTLDPLHRMKQLAILVDGCADKKGGSLASAIHSYTLHGDPSTRQLVKHILRLVAFPIRTMLDKWIFDGQLEDKHNEFFVAADPSIKEDKLWHEKYSLRKSMVPSFISMEQARKILSIGKAINFLRQVCKDHTPIKGKSLVVVTSGSNNYQNTEMLLQQDMDGSFQQVIDSEYRDTSKRLLHILQTQFKFLEHLKAMRRYLLLGQGDFIKHLMDLLEADLAKPANMLYLHNLTGVLETAVRATNAQYEDSDILNRLDVRLLEISPGDTGWDVFSLDYHLDGPISTVFTAQCKILYLRVFNFLWRAKRMEYVLAQVWKNQMANAKALRSIPELYPLLHRCHTIAAEMIHFVNQMQYYINFEVMACSWDTIWKNVTEAADLDQIIAAHELFLDTILRRALLDDKSRPLLNQLRVIFDLIIQFQHSQDTMFTKALEELNRRQAISKAINARTEKGDWGTSAVEEADQEKMKAEFRRTFLPSSKAQMNVLANSYQDMVQKFLVMLTNHSDDSLRLLAVRLDFNEVYRAKEPKLRSPMTVIKKKRRHLDLGV